MKLQFCIYLFIVTFLFSCENNKIEEIKKITEDQNHLIESAENIEMRYSENGNIKAILSAPELTKNRTEKPYSEFNKGVTVKMYDESFNQVSTLTANYGIKYDKEEETIVKNNVIVTNKMGEKLETEKLIRNDKTGALKTDEFVKITTLTEIIYGMGLEANEDFSYYKIDSMTGVIQVNANNFELN